MTISVIVEGKTEKVFVPALRHFLQTRLAGKMPRLDPFPRDGRIPKEDKLRRVVLKLLESGAHAVIALTDVYTGTNEFRDGNDARSKMRDWVGHEPRFYPHAAQYDLEAWLLPYWPQIQRLAGHNRAAPTGPPEHVNHNKPPSRYIYEIFRAGTCSRDYIKVRDAGRILRGQDLAVAANQCSELKALLNTILSLCGGTLL